MFSKEARASTSTRQLAMVLQARTILSRGVTLSSHVDIAARAANSYLPMEAAAPTGVPYLRKMPQEWRSGADSGAGVSRRPTRRSKTHLFCICHRLFALRNFHQMLWRIICFSNSRDTMCGFVVNSLGGGIRGQLAQG